MKKFLGLIVVIFSMMSLCSCERIDAGCAGIRVNLYGDKKGVDDAVLVTGWQWYNPITTMVYEYPTYVQTIDYEPFTVNAKDGSEFVVDPTVSMRVTDEQAPVIFKKYRRELNEIIEGPLFNLVKDAFRIQINKYTTDEIVSQREMFESAIEKQLSQTLESEGFVLEQLTSGLQYPETIVASINAKNKAIQESMRVSNELKIAEAEARKQIVKAEADAEVFRLKTKELTPQILRQMWIEKWDGKLPTVVSDENMIYGLK